MIQNNLLYFTIFLCSSLIGMDAPLFLENIQTLKEFNPTEHQIRLLERIVGIIPQNDLQSLEYSYNQANALTLNPHIRNYHGNFLKHVESWRAALFTQIAHVKQHEKESKGLQNQSEALATELRQSNAALFERLQALEQARNQDQAKIRSLEQETANQKWWNKAFILTGVGAAATVLYVVHKKANAAQPTTAVDIENVSPQEFANLGNSVNARFTAINSQIESVARANTQEKKETITESFISFMESINKTIKYISDSLTGTKTEVADLKKRVSALEKSSVSTEMHNKLVERFNKDVETYNKNLKTDDKNFSELFNRPYPTIDEDNHVHINYLDGTNRKLKSVKAHS